MIIKMKKILKITSLILMIIIIMPTISTATILMENVEIYTKGRTEGLLNWNGTSIGCSYVVYQKDGIEYPAYCLNRELPGVGEIESYSVSVDKLISNVKVWKAIINGYPYKSMEELGCATPEEAFMATKQAVYCMLYDRSPETYSATGEAAQRTLNALKQIVNNANNSTETKVSSDIKIYSDATLWKIDNIDNKYISRTFSVSTKAPMNTYISSLEGNIPEGTIIADEENVEKNEFEYNQKFKILIPLANILEDSNFTLKVEGKVKTKPVFYGASGNSATQDYALTAAMYEDGKGLEKIYYNKNETKIIITKKTNKKDTPLQGVKFELLDNNQNVIYSELLTDENGQVVINNLLPDKYFIKEVKTIEGYSLYDKLIEVDLELNETANITINNSEKEVNIEEKFIETYVEISNSTSEKQIETKQVEIKLPKTGM